MRCWRLTPSENTGKRGRDHLHARRTKGRSSTNRPLPVWRLSRQRGCPYPVPDIPSRAEECRCRRYCERVHHWLISIVDSYSYECLVAQPAFATDSLLRYTSPRNARHQPGVVLVPQIDPHRLRYPQNGTVEPLHLVRAWSPFDSGIN